MHILLHRNGFINSKSNNIDSQCDSKAGDHNNLNLRCKGIQTAAEEENINSQQVFLTATLTSRIVS